VSLLESIRVEAHPGEPDVFTVYHYTWPEKSSAPLIKRAVFRIGRSPNLNLVSTGVKLDHGPWVATSPRRTLDRDMIRVAKKQAHLLTGIRWWRVRK